MPQDLYDLSFRLPLLISIEGQLRHHLMAVHRSHGPLCRYKDIVEQLLIIRKHKSIVLSRIHLKKSHHPGGAPFHDLLHPSFPVPAAACSGKSDFHRVFIHGPVCLIFPDINILVFPFHCHKPESLQIGAEDTGQSDLFTQAVFSPLADCDLPFLCKRFQDLSQFIPFLPGDLENCGDLLLLHRDIQSILHKAVYFLFSFFKKLICH